jgi:zinc transporter ZupT
VAVSGPIVLALVAGASVVSTVVAVALARLGRDRVATSVSAAGIAAGVMLWLAVVEAVPEAATTLGWGVAAATAAVAALAVAAAARAAHVVRATTSALPALAVALALHDLPEGFAVGALVAGGTVVSGLALVAAVTAHNIPEKLAVLAPARAEERGLVLPALAVTLPEPVGAALAVSGAALSPTLLAAALALAAGAMVAVSVDALPALARRHRAVRRFAVSGLGAASLLAVAGFVVPR